MKLALYIIGGFLAIILMICVFIFTSYVSATNYGASTEAQLKALIKNNEQILGNYSLKVLEVAQVPAMMKEDMIDVAKAAISGRYGPDGSQAAFQWITEQNPNVDASVYRQIQQVIEAGRNDFQQQQTRLLDGKAVYEANLNYFWRGKMLALAGYPKINLADIKAVSTDSAIEAFDTGIQKQLKLR